MTPVNSIEDQSSIPSSHADSHNCVQTLASVDLILFCDFIGTQVLPLQICMHVHVLACTHMCVCARVHTHTYKIVNLKRKPQPCFPIFMSICSPQRSHCLWVTMSGWVGVCPSCCPPSHTATYFYLLMPQTLDLTGPRDVHQAPLCLTEDSY